MKKVFAVFAAVLMTALFSFAACAGQILIHNETGFTLFELYISDSGTNDWEEDILGSNVLSDEEAIRITVHGSYDEFDLKAVAEDGSSASWYGLPGYASDITIYADGTAEYR